MSIISEYYSNYVGSVDNFRKFHNQVINMPRDEFSDTDISKIKTIAAYLLLIKERSFGLELNYKEIMELMAGQIRNSNYPNKYRDINFENRYLNYQNIDSHYSQEGRMFRHVMGTAAFFGMITSQTRSKKIILFDKCLEYFLCDDENAPAIYRNNILNININNNDYIASLEGVELLEEADYRPAYGILSYIKSIERPATIFELAILLGRIDSAQKEDVILERALRIGSEFNINEDDQRNKFFGEMEWVNSNGSYYLYAASQEPDFKFKRFILFMISFGLLELSSRNTVVLTEYSKAILSDDIPFYIADLERVVSLLDDDTKSDNEFKDLILYQRNFQFLQAIRDSVDFVKKMNMRSLRNPIIINNKKRRNPLVAELAKIKADYNCQYSDRKIFKMPNGKYYVESHHIIEFTNEDGPDITDNLVILGPEPHKLIHHAVEDEVKNLYRCLVDKQAICFEQFKKMHEVYNCLTEKHVDILFGRNIINGDQKKELMELLNAQA